MATELQDKLEAARAEVRRLEAQAAAAPCIEAGHRWQFAGGTHCGRCDRMSVCSLPVNQCSVCGDWDYGENDEARRQIEACECSRPE